MIDFDNTEELKQLWNNDLNEKNLNEILDDAYFRSLNKINRAKFINEKLKFADKAHVTIGCAKGTPNRQSGIDCMNLKLKTYLNEKIKKDTKSIYSNEEFEVFYIDGCYYLIKLKKNLIYDAIFGAEY
jgi:hypothetical protein